MERTMSVEDKMRRAEEIYNRRRQYEYKDNNTRVSVRNKNEESNKKINKRLRKMIIQIIVCMLIYFIFYYINTGEYIFSADLTKKCEEVLSYDISFNKMYQDIVEVVNQIHSNYRNLLNNTQRNLEEEQEEITIQEEENKSKVTQNVEMEQTEIETEIVEEQETKIPEAEQINQEENIGGPEEQKVSEEQEEQLTEEEQMKEDAEEIKSKISFIKPLEGIITSKYGWRNPTVSTVSKFHTGIDIGVNEGTDIISATNGKVELASSQGAYGNHLKIIIEGVEIIYAHCLSLEVKEGEEITQGQVIAKVGSTGNSTGPHLHFEIKKEGRYINPSLIIDF